MTPVGPDGRFELLGLREGDHTVRFTPWNAGSDVHPEVQHYDGSARATRDPEGDAPITVEAGELAAHLDLRFDVGSSLAGSLVDADGQPRPEVLVVAERRVGNSWVISAGDRSDADGRYQVPLLGEGVHRLSIAGTYYYAGDGRVVTDPDSARELSLESGQAIGGLDAEVVFDWD